MRWAEAIAPWHFHKSSYGILIPSELVGNDNAGLGWGDRTGSVDGIARWGDRTSGDGGKINGG